MNFPTIDEITFISIHDIDKNAPKINCTLCGNTIPEKLENGWMAEVPVYDGGDWFIVLCNDECLNRFCGRGDIPKEVINDFIIDRLEVMRTLK